MKKETPVMADTRIVDGAAPVATSGKKKNSAKKQKTEHTNGDAIVPHLFILSNMTIHKTKPEMLTL